MKPAPFEYERPETIEQAVAALARYGDQAKVLAGGQSLIPMLNLRVAQTDRLIDIGRIATLRGIERVGDELRIGALATHNAILSSATVADACPLMVEAYRDVSHHSVRNRGTLGGSLCHNDPSAEMPMVVSVLGATLVARSASGERQISAQDFFQDSFTTALEANELLVEIRIPVSPQGHGWAFQEVSQRKGDFALVAVAAMLTIVGGVCRDVRIGYRNAGTASARLAEVEAVLEGKEPQPALVAAAAEAATKAVDPTSDFHADADYRRDLAGTLTQRVLTSAIARAKR
jgi:CO/xanthine dehydrogenase FAD-binding subunit